MVVAYIENAIFVVTGYFFSSSCKRKYFYVY